MWTDSRLGIDWYNYGGMTRDVSLVTLPKKFIDDYDVHLKHDATFSTLRTPNAERVMFT